ncbi:MAG: hypothetical protein IT183_10680 [Acidobacteria bacterium]|nr:hypothetical protein [Acidobacteriota bacterium]
MNHDEHGALNVLPPGRIEIDALLDGEAVDKEALRLSLDDSGARDYLIDALLLRQITRDMGPRHYVAPGIPRSPFARSMRWLAASVLLATGAGGGYLYGQQSVPVATSSFEVAVDAGPPVAPEPTQVIRFEAGVNWTRAPRSN